MLIQFTTNTCLNTNCDDNKMLAAISDYNIILQFNSRVPKRSSNCIHVEKYIMICLITKLTSLDLHDAVNVNNQRLSQLLM